MAAQHNVQFGGTMTSAQVSSPAHVLINNSSTLPNERLLHRISMTPSQAQMQGYLVPPNLLSTQTPIVFAGPLMPQPELQEKRRPLNSWMAFRTFYTKIFKDHQQKETSAYLTVLWQRDPFKAKWAIVAKAYSSIRDMVGRPHAPLAGFLTIVVPEIGLLAAEVYLAQLNWDITLRDDGAMVLRQMSEPNFDILPANIVHTSMTERDVIQLCGNRGYISQAIAWTLLRGAPSSRRARSQAARQGLLAIAPAMPPVTPVAPAQPTLPPALPPTNQFVQSAMTNPTAAATQVFGFDVDQLLGYEWTSNVGDIFNADEGHINLDVMVDNDIETDEGFTKLLDLSDPSSFDRALAENNAVEGGFMPLNVNDSQYY